MFTPQKNPSVTRLAHLLDRVSKVAIDTGDTFLNRVERAALDHVKDVLAHAAREVSCSHVNPTDALSRTACQIGAMIRELNKSGLYIQADRSEFSVGHSSNAKLAGLATARLRLHVWRLDTAEVAV